MAAAMPQGKMMLGPMAARVAVNSLMIAINCACACATVAVAADDTRLQTVGLAGHLGAVGQGGAGLRCSCRCGGALPRSAEGGHGLLHRLAGRLQCLRDPTEHLGRIQAAELARAQRSERIGHRLDQLRRIEWTTSAGRADWACRTDRGRRRSATRCAGCRRRRGRAGGRWLYPQARQDIPHGLVQVVSQVRFMGVDDRPWIEAGQRLRQLTRRTDRTTRRHRSPAGSPEWVRSTDCRRWHQTSSMATIRGFRGRRRPTDRRMDTTHQQRPGKVVGLRGSVGAQIAGADRAERRAQQHRASPPNRPNLQLRWIPQQTHWRR